MEHLHLYTRTQNAENFCPNLQCPSCHEIVSYAEAIGRVCGCRACKQSFVIDEETIKNNFSKNLLCLDCARKLRIIRYTLNEMLCESKFDKMTRRREKPHVS